MTAELFTEYHEFVREGFNTFLPLLTVYISVTVAFAIGHLLRYFIHRTVRTK